MAARTSYLTIARDGEAEIEVEKSRFVCTLTRVEDELFARAAVDSARRAHGQARHHCSAFVIGPEGALQRAQDDGEPAGSAGVPMLGVLSGAGVSDVVAVVSRFFGGVLLGTGGLARAYSHAVRATLEEVGTVERRLLLDCSVAVEHARVGQLQHGLRARGFQVTGVDYEQDPIIRLATPPGAQAVTAELVEELTGGEAVITWGGSRWVDLT